MLQHTRKHWLAVIIMSAFIGACVTYGGYKGGHADRGLKPSIHKVHAKQSMGCTDCHTEEKGEPKVPGHDVCTVCHEFNVDKPDPKACGFCHTKPDYTVTPLAKPLNDDVKFSHAPHIEKKVECATCHADPDARELPKGDLMKWCRDCHAAKWEQTPKLNDCTVCHKEINKDTRPKFHGRMRIMHDSPQIWENTHGQESRRDPKFCAICHDKETSCETCHRKTQPKDHTIAWRKKPHGMRAMWDRQRCQACHEEDFCIKCHRHSEPESHRGGWREPLNRHCISCHFPPQRTECAVCHEKIDHEKAPRSPHNIGLYPPHCGLCHPLGLPGRAPHLLNSTVHCVVCHSK